MKLRATSCQQTCIKSTTRMLISLWSLPSLLTFENLAMNKNDFQTVQKIYPTAVPLIDYIVKITDCNVAAIVKVDDSRKYQDFISKSLIVPLEKGLEVHTKLGISKDIQQSSSARDFLNRFVAQMVKSNLPFREQNCLTYGYRSKSSFTDCGMRSHAGLECYFVNTLHNIVASPVWQMLSARVGE